MADKKKQEKKDFTGIASMEAMLEKYIDNNISSIFEKNAKELEKNKKAEYNELSKKYLSIPLNATSTASMQGHNAQIQKIINETGKWQNKGFDWVIEKTVEDLTNKKNADKGEDINNIVNGLRTAIVENIGEKKYKELCKKYKVDIAEAKFQMILSDKMEAYMIKRNMPKSDIDYIIRKLLNDTIAGSIVQGAAPRKTEADINIDEKARKQYNASLITKGTATALSYGLDGITLGQGNVIKAIGIGVGADIGLKAVGTTANWGYNKFWGHTQESYDLDKDIYGASTSKEDINKAKKSAKSTEIQKIANLSLNNKIRQKYSPSEATAISKNYERAGDPDLILKAIKEAGIKVSSRAIPQHMKDKDLKENYRLACYFMGQLTEMKMSGAKTIKVGDTTLTEAQVAQRAHDYAYQAQEQVKEIKARELEEKRKNEIDDLVVDENGDVRLVSYARDSKKGQELAAAEASQSQQQQNQQMVNDQMNNGFGGWASMLGWGGGELPTTPQNMSQVISAIPDLLVGMFTGKNKHLKLSECFFPIAAIMGAMFFKNPIIKLLLFLAGGMMLFQKAKNNMNEENKQNEYRSYKRIPDEPLNPRIKNPVMKGNTLVANIDDCPYVITVSDQAVDAYHKGYIPINALSNKVLEVFDRQQGQIQSDFNQNVTRDEEQQRTRGIK